VNRDEADSAAEAELPTAAELGALLSRRVGTEVGLHDLRWVSDFKMHKREVERLSDGRRFLLGDAAHLSSPLGGEGLNAALLDAGTRRPGRRKTITARELCDRARNGRSACARSVR
jgi:2-polyprenyl-6-methoxyphenol hydroxylase-like FAD-dependent oxidoreductase